MSGKPTGLFTQLEEIDIDIRVSGLPHAVVKQAENFHVRELVKKIESHPHREAFQADLQQNNVFYPFSDDSKAMIREMDNVELFELCETIPKVQCSECFLDWKQGVIYCTCGHLMVESESSQHFHQWRLDALSIGHYVILNPALHHQNGATSWCSARQTDAQKEHFVAREAVKSLPPNTENSMQYGYDENDNNNMSNETKRETNYSTTKWNDVNTHNYMQLTKYNKYTNDNVYTDACVVHMIH